MKFFAEPFRQMWQYRNLLRYTTASDIKSRYAGTMMGVAWAIIYPLLFLALYAVVYVAIFNVRFGEMKSFDYVMLIFAGLIPFLNFTEMLAAGVVSITSNSALIKNTLFPIELIPVKTVLASSLTMLISLGILEGALICTLKCSFFNLLVIPVILLQLLFSFGLCWLLSALNVFLKDIGLFYMIGLYRGVLLEGFLPWKEFLSFFVITMVMFYFGYFVFRRLKGLFADEC